jgi:hypothetical protein
MIEPTLQKSNLDNVMSLLQLEKVSEKAENKTRERTEQLDKQFSGLIKEIETLNKKLANLEKNGNDLGLGRQSLQKWWSDKKSNLKEMTSVSGIVGKLADQTRPGSFTSAVFSTVADKLDSKKIEREREHSFIKSALKGTDPGRKLESEVGEKEAAKRLGQVYQKKFGIEKEIAKLQEKDKILKGDGQITGAGLDQGDTDRLNELKKDLESLGNFFKRIEPKKEESPEETQKEESKKDETRKRNESSTDRELVPEKRRASEVFKEQEESPEETQKKEFILGVQDGIREE